MKKLSLEMLKLTSEEVLERSQMKKITGGYGFNAFHCQCHDRYGNTSMPSSGYFPDLNYAINYTLGRCVNSGLAASCFRL
ncbi:TIGR04149 family rSAM-modified RiPP [Cognataquiflexum aquatile]|uniref:TIGR04149 family rSAM-modified RiPP n=1 Tax=Cognataquiflexum aquatile TaxID=2249427 RepID=UPI000DEA759D|nr:TIGR04149 family rSAM-modified RiPP [Cognataquiflexum aquatile]